MNKNELTELLKSHGILREDEAEYPNPSFRCYESDGRPTITITFENETKDLPEDILSFAARYPSAVERLQRKSLNHLSYNQVEFYIALDAYCRQVFYADPRISALENMLESIGTIQDLEVYEARRAELWNEVVNENPRVQELENMLEEW